MRNILILGAGRSSSSLIRYLLEHSSEEQWRVTVADVSAESAQKKTGNHPNSRAIAFDILNDLHRRGEIGRADLVISMLPAFMHPVVARDCIHFKKHMVTASYVSDEMTALDADAKKAGLVLMNEIGVDPGIDHLSAMRVIDEVREAGGKFIRFESFTGGLIAPESDNNPWHYKFTWNPRNVVIAGQGPAVKFIQNERYKYIPYHRLFRRTEIIEVEGVGKFEGYANRDSLKYRDVYNLHDIPTIYRGTLRRQGFCRAWDLFVQLGATDDSYVIEGSADMTHRDFINSFLSYHRHNTVEMKLMHYLHLDQDDVELMDKLTWLGIFEQTPIGLPHDSTPAQILQHILEKKWTLEPHDKDMIVMLHKFDYELEGKSCYRESYMVTTGEDQTYTAMAKTVGLPVAIASKMILNSKFTKPGVHIPVMREIYEPVLEELEKYGIGFKEKTL